MAACLEAPRLFPGQLPDLGPYWVEAAIHMNDCLNTTATTANAHFKSPHEALFGTRPPLDTLAFMQPGFHRIHSTHKSDPKAERCFYLNRGRNHPRDCVKVVTACGRTTNSRDVTWEVECKPIIEAAPEARRDTVPRPCEADRYVRYLPPEPATVSPGMPPVMTSAPPGVPPLPPPGEPLQAGMPPAMTPAPPEVPPTPGVMSPLSPPGAENPQV